MKTSGLRSRYWAHEYRIAAHWWLLNPSARRPSLGACSVLVLHQLVYYGLLVSLRAARTDDGLPWYCYWWTRHRLTNEDCVAGARGSISVEVNLHKAQLQATVPYRHTVGHLYSWLTCIVNFSLRISTFLINYFLPYFRFWQAWW